MGREIDRGIWPAFKEQEEVCLNTASVLLMRRTSSYPGFLGHLR